MAFVRAAACLLLFALLLNLTQIHGRYVSDRDHDDEEGELARRSEALGRVEEAVDVDTALSRAVSKRSSASFANIVTKITVAHGKPLLDNVLYLNYGCYCGLGTGTTDATPVDDVDACCKVHDACWSANTDRGCGSGTLAFYRYSFKSGKKDAKCHEPQWYDVYGGCGLRYCKCDVAFAKCLASVHGPDTRNYDMDCSRSHQD